MTEPIDSSEFPSNSLKARKADTAPKEDPAPAAKSKKVITGNVVQKKKTVGESISQAVFGDATRNVGEYILFDVLIPAAKNTLFEMISSGLEMRLFGETRRSSRRDAGSSGRSTVNYASYYRNDRDRDRDRDRDVRIQRGRERYEELIFTKSGDAEEVLDTLLESIDKYGSVSLRELYDAVGWDTDFTDEKYGWKNLGRAYVQRVREGYSLVLPRAVALD